MTDAPQTQNSQSPAEDASASPKEAPSWPRVLPASSSPFLRHRARTFKYVTALVALVAILAVTGVWYAKYHSGGSGSAQKQTPAAQQALDEQIQAAYARKDYAAAAKLIEGQPSAATPEMQIKLALAYSNGGEYQKALAIFDTLDKDGKLTSGYTSAAAEIAVMAGDKATAIHYYEKSKKLVVSEKVPMAKSKVASYDKKIAELEK